MRIELRKDTVHLRGESTLMFTRSRKCMDFILDKDATVKVDVRYFTIQGLRETTRIGRFLGCLKVLWKFCK